MAFTKITVTGTYLKDDGVTPAKGAVTFKLISPLQDATTDEIVAAVTHRVKLDEDGSISVSLVANDDAGTEPTNTYYVVTENIRGATSRSYNLVVLSAAPGGTMDLADVTSASLVPTYTYTLVTTYNAHVAGTGDPHDAGEIRFTPTGTLAATNVQDAIAEAALEGGSGGGASQEELDAKVDKATLDANSILKADTDDTPVALAVPASRIIARLASGGIVAATVAELRALLAGVDDTAPAQRVSGVNGLSGRNFVGRKTTAGAPASGTWVLDDEVVDSNGVRWLCTVAGTPGTWVSFADANVMQAIGGGLEVIETITDAGSTETLDLAQANWFDVTLTTNCTFTFAGATAGRVCAMQILIRQDGTGSHTVTWPGTVTWLGTAPVLSSSGGALTIVTALTIDGGATWLGFGDQALGVIDAAGDLIVGSGNDQVSRLAAASTTGKVIRSNPALATKMEWGFSPAVHRRFSSGQEYGADVVWSATDSLNVGRLLAVPFHGSVPQAWTHISYIVQALGAGSTYRLGMYQGNGAGYPGALLFDAGTVSGAGTGAIALAIPGAPWTNPIDWLWFAVLCEVAGATGRAAGSTTTCLPMPSLTVTSTTGVTAWNVSGVTAGALPSTYPAGGGTGIPAHKMLLRAQ